MGQGLAGAIEQRRGSQNSTFVVGVVSTFPGFILGSPSLTQDSGLATQDFVCPR